MDNGEKQNRVTSERRRSGRQRSMIQRSNTVIEVEPIPPATQRSAARLSDRSYSADQSDGDVSKRKHAGEMRRRCASSDGEMELAGRGLPRPTSPLVNNMAAAQNNSIEQSPSKRHLSYRERNSPPGKRMSDVCRKEHHAHATSPSVGSCLHLSTSSKEQQAQSKRAHNGHHLQTTGHYRGHHSRLDTSFEERDIQPCQLPHDEQKPCLRGPQRMTTSTPSSPCRRNKITDSSAPAFVRTSGKTHIASTSTPISDKHMSAEGISRSPSPYSEPSSNIPGASVKMVRQPVDTKRTERSAGTSPEKQSVKDAHCQRQRVGRSNSIDISPGSNVVRTKSRRSVDVGRICAATSKAMNRSFETLTQDIDDYYALLQAEINRRFDMNDSHEHLETGEEGLSFDDLGRSYSTSNLNHTASTLVSRMNEEAEFHEMSTEVYTTLPHSRYPPQDEMPGSTEGSNRLTAHDHKTACHDPQRHPATPSQASGHMCRIVLHDPNPNDEVVTELGKYYSTLIGETEKLYGSHQAIGAIGDEGFDSDPSKCNDKTEASTHLYSRRSSVISSHLNDDNRCKDTHMTGPTKHQYRRLTKATSNQYNLPPHSCQACYDSMCEIEKEPTNNSQVVLLNEQKGKLEGDHETKKRYKYKLLTSPPGKQSIMSPSGEAHSPYRRKQNGFIDGDCKHVESGISSRTDPAHCSVAHGGSSSLLRGKQTEACFIQDTGSFSHMGHQIAMLPCHRDEEFTKTFRDVDTYGSITADFRRADKLSFIDGEYGRIEKTGSTKKVGAVGMPHESVSSERRSEPHRQTTERQKWRQITPSSEKQLKKARRRHSIAASTPYKEINDCDVGIGREGGQLFIHGRQYLNHDGLTTPAPVYQALSTTDKNAKHVSLKKWPPAPGNSNPGGEAVTYKKGEFSAKNRHSSLDDEIKKSLAEGDRLTTSKDDDILIRKSSINIGNEGNIYEQRHIMKNDSDSSTMDSIAEQYGESGLIYPHCTSSLCHARSSDSLSSSVPEIRSGSLSSNPERSTDSFNSSCLDKYADSFSSFHEKSTTNSLSSLHEKETASVDSSSDRYDLPARISDCNDTHASHQHDACLEHEHCNQHLCVLNVNPPCPVNNEHQHLTEESSKCTSNLMCQKHHRSFNCQAGSCLEFTGSNENCGTSVCECELGEGECHDVHDQRDHDVNEIGDSAVFRCAGPLTAHMEPDEPHPAIEKYYSELITDTTKHIDCSNPHEDHDYIFTNENSDEANHFTKKVFDPSQDCTVVPSARQEHDSNSALMDEVRSTHPEKHTASILSLPFHTGTVGLVSAEIDQLEMEARLMSAADGASLGDLQSSELFYTALSPLTARRLQQLELAKGKQADSSGTDDDNYSLSSNDDFDTCSSDMGDENKDVIDERIDTNLSLKGRSSDEPHTNTHYEIRRGSCSIPNHDLFPESDAAASIYRSNGDPCLARDKAIVSSARTTTTAQMPNFSLDNYFITSENIVERIDDNDWVSSDQSKPDPMWTSLKKDRHDEPELTGLNDELSTINENDTDTDHPFGEKSSERSNSFRDEDTEAIEKSDDAPGPRNDGDIKAYDRSDGPLAAGSDESRKPVVLDRLTEEKRRTRTGSLDEIHAILTECMSISSVSRVNQNKKKNARARSQSIDVGMITTQKGAKPPKKSSLKAAGCTALPKTTHWEDDGLEEGERILKKIATNVSEIIISMTTSQSENPLYILFNFLEKPARQPVGDGTSSVQDGYWTVVQAMQQHDQFLEGMLLKNVDSNSIFPYLHYVVFNTSKEGRFIQEPHWTRIIDDGYGPEQTTGQAAYEEMYTFIDPSLPFLPKRSNNPNVAYIISGFRTLGGVDHLDETWSIWSGADFIVANIPPNLKLQRLTLHKRIVPVPNHAPINDRFRGSSAEDPSSKASTNATANASTSSEHTASTAVKAPELLSALTSNAKKTTGSAGNGAWRQTKNTSVGTGPFSYVLVCELSEALSDVMRTREFIEKIKSRECGFTSLYTIDHFF